MLLRVDGDGQIHEVPGHGAGLADLAVHGGQEILGGVHLRALVRALQDAPKLVKDIDVPVGHIDTEPRLGHQQLLHLGGAVLPVGQRLQLGNKLRRKRPLHLDVKLRNIEITDTADQKRTDHRHQCQNEDDHDHDHLHAKRAHRLRPLSCSECNQKAPMPPGSGSWKNTP